MLSSLKRSEVVNQHSPNTLKCARSADDEVVAAVCINDCFDGYNTTIFAYGQTGTGKTHTVLGLNLWEMAEKHAESMEGGGVATFDPQEINAQEEM